MDYPKFLQISTVKEEQPRPKRDKLVGSFR